MAYSYQMKKRKMNNTYSILKFLARFCFLLLVIFQSFVIRSQELGAPFIKNFVVSDYRGGATNFSITQDKRGVMFFGNQSGVVEFDGKNWNTIKKENKSTVRSLDTDSAGNVYVGAYGEFGVLQPNEGGELVFKSLSKNLESEIVKDVWKTVCSDRGTYFFTYEKIYRWHQNKLTAFNNPASAFFCEKVGDRLISNIENEGLAILNDTTFEVIPIEGFTNKGILNIVEYKNDEILIFGRKKGVFTYNFENNNYSRFITEADQYLLDNSMYCAVKINDDKYAIGTLTGGIVIIDASGKLVQIINEKRGLNSNFVPALYVDREGNLWAGLQNGIARIDISYPCYFYNEDFGIKYWVTGVVKSDARLYVATSNNLLYSSDTRKIGANNYFKEIKGVEGAFGMITFNNQILAYGKNGIYQINDTIAQLIHPQKNTEQYLAASIVDQFPDYLITATTVGLKGLLVDTSNKKRFRVMNEFYFPEIISGARYLVSEGPDKMWLYTLDKKLVYIKFYDNIEDHFIQILTSDKGLPENSDYRIEIINNEAMILTNKGIYKPEFDNDSVITFNHASGIFDFINKDSLKISAIVEFPADKYFIMGDIMGFFDFKDDTLVIDSVAFNRLSLTISETKNVDNKLYMLSADGLYVYDPTIQKNYEIPFTPLIRKVTIAKDSVIFKGTFYETKDSVRYVTSVQTEDFIPVLDYDFNALSLAFAPNYYEKSESVQFKHRLEGFEKEWSDWDTETKAVYTNIPEGKYKFQLVARSIFGHESEIAEYAIIILPPWYRTTVAYIVYVILFAVVISTIVKLYNLRLLMLNKKLEKMVQDRTNQIKKKNVQLKESFDELQSAHKVLVHKNLELVQKEKSMNKTLADFLKMNKQDQPTEKIAIDEEVKEEIWIKVKLLFDNEKVYLDPSLTLDDVAKSINHNRVYLSKVINEKFGRFNDLLSKYRIEEAMQMLVGEEYDKFTIEGIANEVGFKSLSTFNPIFKKITGMTPTEFRRNSMNENESS